MAKKKKQDPENSISFEESFAELQQIVDQLEEGQLTLGQSLDQYEKGIRRLRECYQALDRAEQRIKLLVDLDADGNLITTEFRSSAEKTDAGQSNHESSVVDEGSDEEYVDDDRSLF